MEFSDNMQWKLESMEDDQLSAMLDNTDEYTSEALEIVREILVSRGVINPIKKVHRRN